MGLFGKKKLTKEEELIFDLATDALVEQLAYGNSKLTPAQQREREQEIRYMRAREKKKKYK